MLESCNACYSWCWLLSLFLPDLKLGAVNLNTISVGFGISQMEIALLAFHRPDIFSCKLYGCNISIKIDIEQLNFKKFEYTLFAPSSSTQTEGQTPNIGNF